MKPGMYITYLLWFFFPFVLVTDVYVQCSGISMFRLVCFPLAELKGRISAALAAAFFTFPPPRSPALLFPPPPFSRPLVCVSLPSREPLSADYSANCSAIWYCYTPPRCTAMLSWCSCTFSCSSWRAQPSVSSCRVSAIATTTVAFVDGQDTLGLHSNVLILLRS